MTRPAPHGHRFPVDEVTLTLLESACKMNPDLGRTTLHDFLQMGAGPVIEEEWIEPNVVFADFGDHPPFTPHEVILALIAEIRRLREGAVS